MTPPEPLRGLVALVTGGAGGIGRAVAIGLLRAGASVVVVSRNGDRLQEAVASLTRFGRVEGIACDVTDETAVDVLLERVAEIPGCFGVLVCSHGMMTAGDDSLLDIPLARWREIVEVNLVATFICGRAAARLMIDRKHPGRIINISSIAALAAPPGLSAYNASKGGVEALTRSMAVDLASFGITVNSVAPGRVQTDMVAALPPPGPRTNPVGRAADPAEIARAVVWLADPATSFVTGATIVIDGGRRAQL